MSITRPEQGTAAGIAADALIHLHTFDRDRAPMRLMRIGPVLLELLRRSGHRMSIEYLGTDAAFAGRGLARAVLGALCDIADVRGWVLTVEPTPLGADVDPLRLRHLFQRYGFVLNCDLTERAISASAMYRRPTRL